MLKEFRVTWQMQPFNSNPKRVLFVEAKTAEDAKILAADYLERKLGIVWGGQGGFSIHDMREVTKVMPAGAVREAEARVVAYARVGNQCQLGEAHDHE